jgi:hypothetical protein
MSVGEGRLFVRFLITSWMPYPYISVSTIDFFSFSPNKSWNQQELNQSWKKCQLELRSNCNEKKRQLRSGLQLRVGVAHLWNNKVIKYRPRLKTNYLTSFNTEAQNQTN